MINSLIFNTINAALTLYLFIVFIWWWVKLKDATDVYKATAFLMLGLTIQYIALVVCNFKSAFLNLDYDDIVAAWFVVPSKFLVTFSLVWYASYISKKVFVRRSMGRRVEDMAANTNCPHRNVCTAFDTYVKIGK